MPQIRNLICVCLPAEQFENDDYSYTYANILGAVIEANHDLDSLDCDDIRQSIDEIAENYSGDFTFDFDGNEYRVIQEGAIWGIYVEEIKNIVTNCYDLNLDKIPSFISVSVDWEATAHNAFADGYAHTFATYDGEEINAPGYYIFRTN